ncbi:type II secretion system F family protein [Halostreptopolyspora alba]|uniref:Type II secretion system protein GspF domain-containing protein n=1 Tax=Halostreptopolyspora alba TaxID=2487137 RepID=A0A3N0E698_9ACTN|nr:hypothetical protein EFW17_16225 [Nocardiopsaceae bacterium YIM 96095]
MSLVALATVAFGAIAVRLLVYDGSFARRRLAALLPPAAPRAEKRNRWLGHLVRASVGCLPALTLALLLDPVAGLVTGAVLGGVLCWRTCRRPGRTAGAGAVAGLPVAVDLLAAGVRAGGTISGVLAAVTPALGGPLGGALAGVAERVRLGAEPAAAWRGPHAPAELAAVGRAIARASETGAPITDILERQATEARQRERTRVHAATQRLGVLVVAPLGLCFLPAFVLIGIVPLAAGLISGLELS